MKTTTLADRRTNRTQGQTQREPKVCPCRHPKHWRCERHSRPEGHSGAKKVKMIHEGRKERIGLPKGEASRDVSQKKVDRSTLQLRPLTATGDLGLGLGIWDLGLLRGSRKATSVIAMSDVTLSLFLTFIFGVCQTVTRCVMSRRTCGGSNTSSCCCGCSWLSCRWLFIRWWGTVGNRNGPNVG